MSATESLYCVHTCQPYCQNQPTAAPPAPSETGKRRRRSNGPHNQQTLYSSPSVCRLRRQKLHHGGRKRHQLTMSQAAFGWRRKVSW
ncbi:hypothetical protein PAMP_008010 [Pampus punctatissimus]